MKVFFDMEFTGLHQLTTPISIGLITEYGETFYAEFTDYSQSQVDDWIKNNVIDNLLFGSPDTPYPIGIKKIADEQVKAPVKNVFINHLKDWLYDLHDKDRYYSPKGKLEMWADCLSYDWMLFCEPWGGALEIPEIIYYIPFDLSTLFKAKGVDPDINREEFIEVYGQADAKHNSLWDARVIKACYDKLESLKQ